MKGKRRKYYHDNPLGKLPTTWRTDFAWDRLNLTPAMRKALRGAAETGNLESCLASTRKALEARDLCDEQGALSDQGRVLAISWFPLVKQCEILKLPLSDVTLSYTGNPEVAMMEFLSDGQRRVSFCEGGVIKLTLYCLCFERIYRLMERFFGSSESARSFTYTATGMMSYGELLQDHPELPSKMIEDIENNSEATLLQAFDTLKSWQPWGEWTFMSWVGVDREMVCETFRALGRDRLGAIGRTLLQDPYAFTKGWPDLICVEHNEVQMLEVKTSDKLHISQIITIPTMAAEAGLATEVVRLVRKYW